MLRGLLASGVSAVVLFVWGFSFWMLTPVPKLMVKPVPNEEGLAIALRAYLHEDGHYFIPAGCEVMQGDDEDAKKAFQKRMEEGPIAQIIYRSHLSASMPTTMGMGFGHSMACSALAAVLLSLARIRTFAARWLFVSLLGVFAAGSVTLCQPIWFQATWQFSLLYAASDVVGWTLAGVVLAGLLVPKD